MGANLYLDQREYSGAPHSEVNPFRINLRCGKHHTTEQKKALERIKQCLMRSNAIEYLSLCNVSQGLAAIFAPSPRTTRAPKWLPSAVRRAAISGLPQRFRALPLLTKGAKTLRPGPFRLFRRPFWTRRTADGSHFGALVVRGEGAKMAAGPWETSHYGEYSMALERIKRCLMRSNAFLCSVVRCFPQRRLIRNGLTSLCGAPLYCYFS